MNGFFCRSFFFCLLLASKSILYIGGLFLKGVFDLRLGVLDDDKIFVSRFEKIIRNFYDDKITFLDFPGIKKAQIAAREKLIDIFLIDRERVSETIVSNIEKNCAVVVLTDDPDYSDPFFITACKYQSADKWSALFSELCGNGCADLGGGTADTQKPKKSAFYLFASASGGVGTTSAAAAFCCFLAGRGKPPLYLSGEAFPSTKRCFSGKGAGSFDEVLSSLKRKRTELPAAIKKVVSVDSKTGIYFFNPGKSAAEVFSLSGEEYVEICDAVLNSGIAEAVVLDMTFDATENIVLPLINADKIVLVTNGTENANDKLLRFAEVVPEICSFSSEKFNEKTYLLYNNFSNESSVIPDTDIVFGKLGGINHVRKKEENSHGEEKEKFLYGEGKRKGLHGEEKERSFSEEEKERLFIKKLSREGSAAFLRLTEV